MAAAVLVDRIDGDVIGLADGSQHVGLVRLKLGMVAQQLVVPDARWQDKEGEVTALER